MVQRIKELELKEEEERQQKILAGKELLKQVMTANQAQARDKIARKQEELEEDMRIMNYLKEKELRESREEAEKARICAAKDAEHQKMMMAQEKILDQTEALDELRAKRYQEAKERKWRRSQLVRKKERNTKPAPFDSLLGSSCWLIVRAALTTKILVLHFHRPSLRSNKRQSKT